MKRWFTVPVLAAIVAALSSSLSAQWPLGPQPGVPKGPTASRISPRLRHEQPTASRICPASGCERPAPRRRAAQPAGRPPLATFGNVGAGFKEGLPFQPWAAELVKKRAGALRQPRRAVSPARSAGSTTYDPQPREIVQLPRQDPHRLRVELRLRTIYTDGRRLPKLGEPQPYWHGYSVGRWEGDTLVVESNNFRGALTGQPGRWMARLAEVSPFTDALKMTERFRRVNFGNLHIDVTIDDPKAYSRPFTVRIEQVDRGRRLGDDRVHLPREPDVPEDDRPGAGQVIM